MPLLYPSLAGKRDIPEFSKRHVVADTLAGAAVGSIFGLNVLLVRQSLGPYRTFLGGLHNKVGTLAVFASVAAAYGFAEAVSANYLQKETALNSFWGGAASGAITGAFVYNATPAKSLGGAIIMGLIASTISWGFDRGKQQSLQGSVTAETKITNEHPRQGFWELVQRRPLSQTVEELGDLAKQFLRD